MKERIGLAGILLSHNAAVTWSAPCLAALTGAAFPGADSRASGVDKRPYYCDVDGAISAPSFSYQPYGVTVHVGRYLIGAQRLMMAAGIGTRLI